MNIVDELKKSNPDLRRLLKLVDQPGQSAAVKRGVMKLFSLIDIPNALQGLAFDKSFKLFSERSSPIAVKVFAMTVMTNVAMEQPELKNEVIIAIEQQFPFGSPAFRSRAAKLLKRLKK